MVACLYVLVSGVRKENAPNLNNEPIIQTMKKALVKQLGARNFVGNDEEILDRQRGVAHAAYDEQTMTQLSEHWMAGIFL